MKRILLLLLTVVSASIYASGFALPEHGAKPVSMGNAFTAVADDASALFYNPSGITQLEKTINFNIGGTLLVPRHEWKNDDITENSQVHYPIAPHFNFVYKVMPKLFLGFSVSAPYAAKIEWEEKWTGSATVEMMNLQTIDLSPTIAYKVMKGLSLALTYDLGIAVVELRKRVKLAGDDWMEINMASSEAALGHGFKASLLYEIGRLRTGLVFKYGKKFDFKGNADFDVTNDVFLPIKPHDQSMELTLNLPMGINWGISYYIIPNKFLVSFDVNYTMWSSYDELKFEFEYDEFDEDENGDKTNISRTEKDWNDVFAFRLGTEYMITPEFALRAGYAYDINPVPDETLDPSLPDADRHIMNIGLGYSLNNQFQFDLSYSYVLFTERESKNEEIPELDGTYNSNVNIVSFTAGFKF